MILKSGKDLSALPFVGTVLRTRNPKPENKKCCAVGKFASVDGRRPEPVWRFACFVEGRRITRGLSPGLGV